MRSVEVDFNDRDDRDFVSALLEGSEGLVPGDLVWVFDAEGNKAKASVSALDVNAGLVYLSVQAGTFMPAEPPTTEVFRWRSSQRPLSRFEDPGDGRNAKDGGPACGFRYFTDP